MNGETAPATQGQNIISNRANSRAEQLHQYRSLIAKNLLSVLGISLCFSPASMHVSPFPMQINCVAHQLDSVLG